MQNLNVSWNWFAITRKNRSPIVSSAGADMECQWLTYQCKMTGSHLFVKSENNKISHAQRFPLCKPVLLLFCAQLMEKQFFLE